MRTENSYNELPAELAEPDMLLDRVRYIPRWMRAAIKAASKD